MPNISYCTVWLATVCMNWKWSDHTSVKCGARSILKRAKCVSVSHRHGPTTILLLLYYPLHIISIKFPSQGFWDTCIFLCGGPSSKIGVLGLQNKRLKRSGVMMIWWMSHPRSRIITSPDDKCGPHACSVYCNYNFLMMYGWEWRCERSDVKIFISFIIISQRQNALID